MIRNRTHVPLAPSRDPRWMGAAIIFMSGLVLGLPTDLRVQIGHGVFLDNLLVMTYACLFLVSGRLSGVLAAGPARRLAALIAALAALGVLSAAAHHYVITDAGKAARLIVLAAEVLLVVRWSRVHGSTFILRWYLVGLAVGGATNIYITVAAPSLTIGPLAVLYDRNGAGGFLAMGLVLGAWLTLLRRGTGDLIAALAASSVGLVAAVMSYSRTAMLIALFGVAAWICVLGPVVGGRRRRRIGLISVLAVLVVLLGLRTTTRGTAYWDAVATSVQQKFDSITVSRPGSVAYRYMYYWAVWEIVVEHPLTGVSYAGFYKAIIRTAAYQSGRMVEESDSEWGQANPHNSFLYHAAGTGVPGFVVACIVFFYAGWLLLGSVRPFGRVGIGVWACLMLGYVVYGITLPSLFNTTVLYVPASVATLFCHDAPRSGHTNGSSASSWPAADRVGAAPA
jgi:hypothetical protein